MSFFCIISIFSYLYVNINCLEWLLNIVGWSRHKKEKIFYRAIKILLYLSMATVIYEITYKPLNILSFNNLDNWLLFINNGSFWILIISYIIASIIYIAIFALFTFIFHLSVLLFDYLSYFVFKFYLFNLPSNIQLIQKYHETKVNKLFQQNYRFRDIYKSIDMQFGKTPFTYPTFDKKNKSIDSITLIWCVYYFIFRNISMNLTPLFILIQARIHDIFGVDFYIPEYVPTLKGIIYIGAIALIGGICSACETGKEAFIYVGEKYKNEKESKMKKAEQEN